MKELHPKLFEECQNYLGHRTIMTHPDVILKKMNLQLHYGKQTPGTYAITFPGAYHFGFNGGRNVAEVIFKVMAGIFNFVSIQVFNYRQLILPQTIGLTGPWIANNATAVIQNWIFMSASHPTLRNTFLQKFSKSGNQKKNIQPLKEEYTI